MIVLIMLNYSLDNIPNNKLDIEEVKHSEIKYAENLIKNNKIKIIKK